MKSPLLVHGMHGLGDNLHQRAVLRQLMEGHEVWLESSWVAPYHDLIADGLHVLAKPTALRTQAKNARRERRAFSRSIPPRGAKRVQVWYRPKDVRRTGSVLGAMCEAVGADIERADFRLPVPAAWRANAAAALLASPVGSRVDLDRWQVNGRPILFYRPLVERTEWGGCSARNPDHAAYASLLRSIRDQFFLVSVADLVPGKEWSVGEDVRADMEFHAGELPFEALAGLMAHSAMAFCSPGFAAILAQAVGTPVACVFGGYESSRSFSAGGRFTPTLGIDPITPCECFSHAHACAKAIDLPVAAARLSEFAAFAAGGGRAAA